MNAEPDPDPPGARHLALPQSAARRAVPRVLAVAVAVALAVDAYVHLHDAHLYTEISTSTVSQATLFRIEATAAILAAVALLLRPTTLTWALALFVSAGGAGAVLLYTNVNVGRLGPLPNMYEPTWALPGKEASLWFEAAGAVLALTGLALSLLIPQARGAFRASSRPAAVRRGG
jgi:hypothetical protein